LEAQLGRPTGTGAARRLRRAGMVPGTVYGHGTDPVSVAVGAKDLRSALSGGAGTNTLLSLRAGARTYLTMARELQRHPVRGTVMHVDFVVVRRDEVISAEVPISLVGEAIEVAHGDGMVDQQLFTLSVRARPGDIPHAVELDISGLTIGSALRVADLALPRGVEIDADPEATVVVAHPPRVESAAGAAEAASEDAATSVDHPGPATAPGDEA